jgi:hypothetical protein
MHNKNCFLLIFLRMLMIQFVVLPLEHAHGAHFRGRSTYEVNPVALSDKMVNEDNSLGNYILTRPQSFSHPHK